MDVRDYEYIVAIADQGNISRAAATLFISQPALTKFLQRIENQLGISLFVRRGAQFTPTEAGRAYVDAGRSILAIDNKLTEKMTQALAMQKQILRVGYSLGRSDEFIGKILPRFFAQYPDIQIQAIAGSSAGNLAALAKGDLDLALIVVQGQPAGCIQIPLKKSRLCLVVREDDPLASVARDEPGQNYPSVELSDIKKARFVVPSSDTISGRYCRRVLARHRLSDRIALNVSDINSCLDAVEAGIGVGLLFSIPLGLHKLKFLAVRDIDVYEQDNSLLYRADWEPTLPAQYLIRLIQNCE